MENETPSKTNNVLKLGKPIPYPSPQQLYAMYGAMVMRVNDLLNKGEINCQELLELKILLKFLSLAEPTILSKAYGDVLRNVADENYKAFCINNKEETKINTNYVS